MKFKPDLEAQFEAMGNEHVSSAEQTPLRPDAFLLSDAEKMLIQRLSAFIPLHHIKNGTLGIKGHVCCFPQDIMEICKELPRLPKDLTVVKILKTFKEEIDNGSRSKTFEERSPLSN